MAQGRLRDCDPSGRIPGLQSRAGVTSAQDQIYGPDGSVDIMADDWTDDRRQTAYHEARAVLEEQNGTMADIDDKAMRTVRITAVIIGLLIGAIQIDFGMFNTILLMASFLLLVVSVLIGIATYDESNLYVGPTGEYIEELAGDATYETSWDRDLLETFAGMIDENHDDIRRNARFLGVTNLSLALGIVAAVLAVVI